MMFFRPETMKGRIAWIFVVNNLDKNQCFMHVTSWIGEECRTRMNEVCWLGSASFPQEMNICHALKWGLPCLQTGPGLTLADEQINYGKLGIELYKVNWAPKLVAHIVEFQ